MREEQAWATLLHRLLCPRTPRRERWGIHFANLLHCRVETVVSSEDVVKYCNGRYNSKTVSFSFPYFAIPLSIQVVQITDPIHARRAERLDAAYCTAGARARPRPHETWHTWRSRIPILDRSPKLQSLYRRVTNPRARHICPR